MERALAQPYQRFWGDLHSHCAISYGHGSLERALQLARQQLDFASITGHAFWPDMPTDRARYGPLIDYHRAGFAKLQRNWPDVQRTCTTAIEENRFLPFLGYEWHSLASGDHHVLYRGTHGPLIDGETLAALRRNLLAQDRPFLLVPHHTGYPRGVRGINWDDYRPEQAPLVEVYSLHGCAESDEAPYPMLHTMGPRDHDGTAQAGLARGQRFGFVASTDHHAGYPGSYGDGRLAVYATALTYEALWEAFLARRTYAVAGDKIAARFAVNGVLLGGETQGSRREIAIEAIGADFWDGIEVVKNGRVWRRWAPLPGSTTPEPGKPLRAKVRIE